MGRRGRPPHPDVLTPREWEVHALLREGLSNEEIAQRLGISLAGAKYHVSEILGKLGVASREEAARWTPERRPWWATAALAPVASLWRRAGSSWLATGAAAGAFLVVAAGLGLLIWGLLRTSGDGDESTLTCVPQEMANLLVNVESVDATSFTGPAGSTIYTPAGDVTVRVDETTNWTPPGQGIDDVRPGRQFQAVGPIGADCVLDAVTVLQGGSATPFFTTLGEGTFGGADWSPDSRSVAFVLDGVLHRADGPPFERYVQEPLIAEPPEFPMHSPKWSPDRRRIAFVSRHQGRFGDDSLDSLTIYVVNADGTGLRDLLPGAAADLAPTDSKELEDWLDDDTLLFNQGCGTACRQPYLLHVDAREVEPVVRVTNPTTGAAEAGILGTVYFYSPDKRRIAVEDLSLPTVSLYDRETGELRLLVPERERITPWQWFGSWAADGSAILYDSAESEDGLQYAPPFSLHMYNVSTGEDRVLAEGKRGAFSADGSQVAYVTGETAERPCGGDARVACIAVMDLSSGEELYRFAGPPAEVLEGYPEGWYPPQFLPDGRVLYVTAAGDLAIADGARTGLLLNADNVIDVLLSPDGTAAVVAEPGRLTLVPVPARGGPSLPEPAPLSPPDVREAPTATAEVLTADGGIVRGRVYVADAEQTPQDAGMLIIPVGATQPFGLEQSVPNGDINQTPSGRRSGPGFLRAGADGTYVVTGLAPGDYFVGSTDTSSDYDAVPPELVRFSIFGEVSTMRAFRVTIARDEATRVDIVFAGPETPEGPSSFRVCVSSYDPDTLEPGSDRVTSLEFQPADPNMTITLLADGCAFVDNVSAGTYTISYETARGFADERSVDIGPGEHGGQMNFGFAPAAP
jgi:DNA-binding CsgD family transcriptional regulator